MGLWKSGNGFWEHDGVGVNSSETCHKHKKKNLKEEIVKDLTPYWIFFEKKKNNNKRAKYSKKIYKKKTWN